MAIPDDLDSEKLAEVVLGVLWLGAHGYEGVPRVWKSVDWDVMDLLHEKGWISDPKSKAKSVTLTNEGAKVAPEFLRKHFRSSK